MEISSVSYNYNFISNHLGSGTLITDINGNSYQFFLNLPFGETFVDRHSHTGNYENVYKFNGKELDTETNLYYYGARYYNPRISQFYATDPLAEKYPGINPYVYTIDNPINYIDPTGMMCQDTKGKTIPCPKGHEDHNGPTATTLVFDKNGKVEAEIGYDEEYGGQLDTVVITLNKNSKCNSTDKVITSVGLSLTYTSEKFNTYGKNLINSEGKVLGKSGNFYEFKSRSYFNQYTGTKEYLNYNYRAGKTLKFAGKSLSIASKVTGSIQFYNLGEKVYNGQESLATSVIPMIDNSVMTFGKFSIAAPWYFGYHILGEEGLGKLKWYNETFLPWTSEQIRKINLDDIIANDNE